ncbi:MAG: alpha/beta fold hydrolase [Bacteroidia bacterium]
MQLNFQQMGTGSPVVILHGIFGSGDNWLTLGRRFAESYTVYLIDQRNHGQSPWSDEFSYSLLADDLCDFLDEQGLERVHLIGHSMGGKVSMLFAQRYPERLDKLVVVDIAPKSYMLNEHKHILETLSAFDLNAHQTRTEIDQALQTALPDYGTRQFILKNIYRNEQKQFAWRLNVKALYLNLHEIGKGLEPAEPHDGSTLFINGGKSRYIQAEDHVKIKSMFRRAELFTIPEAGHWVHAEAPEKLFDIVTEFLART